MDQDLVKGVSSVPRGLAVEILGTPQIATTITMDKRNYDQILYMHGEQVRMLRNQVNKAERIAQEAMEGKSKADVSNKLANKHADILLEATIKAGFRFNKIAGTLNFKLVPARGQKAAIARAKIGIVQRKKK